MTLDEYLDEVKSASATCIAQSIASQDYVQLLIARDPKKAQEIISIRSELICDGDRKSLGGYLEIGYFVDFTPIERLALFAFTFDVSHLITVDSLKARLSKYNKDQKIFEVCPTLFDSVREAKSGKRDFELLDVAHLQNVDDSEIFSKDACYFKADPLLEPSIYLVSNAAFPSARMFIRLDPTFAQKTRPPIQLNEAVLIPANPKWWKRLSIHKNRKEGASYVLEPSQLGKPGDQDYLDYHIGGLRRLDVIASRDNKGNLSMMIEELSNKYSDSGITIGRCIHLDTDDPIDTPFDQAMVNHLDLAINVYDARATAARYEENLASGRVVQDATFRSHLFRIEKVPLASVLLYAVMFLKSRALVDEWVFDQFDRLVEQTSR